MNNKKNWIIIIVAFALISLYGIYNQTIVNKQKKEIHSLESKISNLEDKLETAEAKVEELEDDLSKVKHFDDNATVGNGYDDDRNSTAFTGSVHETQIDGEFNGWDGETIFKMMDGSIWQQASYDYTYHYAYMPDVIIYNKNGSSYMKVEGVDDQIEVRRIK